jgi:hypothetical protein
VNWSEGRGSGQVAELAEDLSHLFGWPWGQGDGLSLQACSAGRGEGGRFVDLLEKADCAFWRALGSECTVRFVLALVPVLVLATANERWACLR